jgi:hypothetical protein
MVKKSDNSQSNTTDTIQDQLDKLMQKSGNYYVPYKPYVSGGCPNCGYCPTCGRSNGHQLRPEIWYGTVTC